MCAAMIALRPLRPNLLQRVPRVLASSSPRLQPFHSSTTTRCDAFTAALESNKKWADETIQRQPDFFTESAKAQYPQILWLGCCDSRVPETTILGFKPGDIFVHRNIANMVNPTDLSILSVIEFSVRYLLVKHIVVCGHTSCGGVLASLDNKKLNVMDLWLQPVRTLREEHAAELEKLDEADRATYLAKLNIKAGVHKLRRMATVLEAVRDRDLKIHGVFYHLEQGRLENLNVSEEDESLVPGRLDAFQTE